MKLLLDTHAVLWTLLDEQRLSRTAAAAIRDARNSVFVSVISAWEIEIKRAKGKLPMERPLQEALESQRFLPLSLNLTHVLAVEALPRIHRDPFDRILLAQAQQENMTLVTADRESRRYPVATLTAR